MLNMSKPNAVIALLSLAGVTAFLAPWIGLAETPNNRPLELKIASMNAEQTKLGKDKQHPAEATLAQEAKRILEQQPISK